MLARLLTPLAASVAAATLAIGMAGAAEGKAIRIVLPEEPPTLDACELNDSSVARILRNNVVEGLVARDAATGQIGPGLATSWTQVSPTEWDFTLREGVEFHDGTPFNAEAAVTSLKRAFLPELRCSGALDYFGTDVPTIAATGDYTVRITTTAADPILPLRLSPLGISAPSTQTDRQTETPVGTGPYSFVSWEHGDKITLTQFADYWGDKPQITDATYVFRSEPQVRANMVSANEADLTVGLTPQFVGTEGVVQFPIAEVVILRMDARGSAPFNDIRVRRAINYALDRQGIIDAIWNGAATPASQVVTPDVDGYNPDVAATPYDPEKAMQLLEEAKADGIDISVPITMANRPDLFANGDQLAQVIAEQLNAIGFNITVQPLASAAWVEVLKSNPPDRNSLLMEAHSNALGDASPSLHARFDSTQGRSQVPDANTATLDGLITKGDSASGDERTQAFRQAFAYIADEVVQDAPIANIQGVMMTGPNVNYEPNLLSSEIISLSAITLD